MGKSPAGLIAASRRHLSSRPQKLPDDTHPDMSPRLLPLIFLAVLGQASGQSKVVSELAALKAQYAVSVDKITAPLQQKYVAELKRLKENYTKAGDVDSALVIHEEWKNASSVLDTGKEKLPDNAVELKEFLMKNGWVRMGYGWTYIFGPDGKFLSEKDNTYKGATYTVTGRRKVTIFWTDPNVGMPCLLSEDCQAIAELGGGRTVWTQGPR